MRRALLGLCLCPWLVLAATEPAAERQRITHERQALQQRHAEELAACRRRFAVTGCVDEAARRQRAALEVLRDRELALDDADRRGRAAQRLQGIEARGQQAARPAPGLAPAGESAHDPVSRAPGPQASAAAAPGPTARRAAPDAAAAAARRASAAKGRSAESEANRRRVEARELARAAKGRPSAPLPVPTAEAIASGVAAR